MKIASEVEQVYAKLFREQICDSLYGLRCIESSSELTT